MTVIAANLKEMAGDSLVSVGGTAYRADKIFHIRDSFVGVAGSADNTTKFLAWFRKECPADEPMMTLDEDSTFQGLVLNSRGLFYYANCTEPDRLHDKHFAIGVGADFALSKLDEGKSPAEAVRYACKRSTSCGLPVKVLTLKAKDKRKRAGVKTALPLMGAQTDEVS